MIPISTEALHDVTQFGKCLIHTLDLDPVYPLMSTWLAEEKTTFEEQFWAIFVYMNWYSLPSTICVFNKWRTLKDAKNDKSFPTWLATEGNALPIGMERRGFRGGRLSVGMLQTMEQLEDRLAPFISTHLSSDLILSRKKIEEAFKNLVNWGPWSAFKVCDLLQYVTKLPLKCGDMSLKGRTQYDAFELLLTTKQAPIKQMDEWGLELEDILRPAIPEITQDILETIICKFHAMTTGHYAVGYDISVDNLKVENMKKKLANPEWLQKYQTIKDKTFAPELLKLRKVPLNAYNRGLIICPICGIHKSKWNIIDERNTLDI